eukprot:scaffold96769_cov63-Cyclotella_meneghiniana.AAC.3
MGQSSLGRGIANNFTSNNSAALFLQACLCAGQWAFWQLALQYFTDRQELHAFRSMPALPQSAQQSNDDSAMVTATARPGIYLPCRSFSFPLRSLSHPPS